MRLFRIVFVALLLCDGWTVGMAQAVPQGDQLDQLVAPVALYPDQLLAQICAASTDPQQIADADKWLKQNKSLQGQALTDAAQKQGFDPAFISLVTFPQVLDMMAAHLDDYAALGAAFKADQKKVMASIQKLRQAAYASGALDTNEYQKVAVQQQGSTQVIVVQPANPQVVYVPQYQPQQVYTQPPPAQASGPSTGEQVAAGLLTFGAGIALGALIANNNQPYGWGGWGWGWGGGGMMVHNNVFVVNNRYVSPHPYYRPRPPVYGHPVYARPPTNWYARPGYRPPPSGYRAYGPNYPGYRAGMPAGYRPPPPAGGAYRPPPAGGAYRPPPGSVSAGNVSATRSATPPPGGVGATRPAPGTTNAPKNVGAIPRPQPQTTGAREGAFGGSSNGNAERQASQRGHASAGGRRQ
jgi:Protein of unknown function (DUF3300)